MGKRKRMSMSLVLGASMMVAGPVIAGCTSGVSADQWAATEGAIGRINYSNDVTGPTDGPQSPFILGGAVCAYTNVPRVTFVSTGRCHEQHDDDGITRTLSSPRHLMGYRGSHGHCPITLARRRPITGDAHGGHRWFCQADGPNPWAVSTSFGEIKSGSTRTVG